jgi:hypothetical protein
MYFFLKINLKMSLNLQAFSHLFEWEFFVFTTTNSNNNNNRFSSEFFEQSKHFRSFSQRLYAWVTAYLGVMSTTIWPCRKLKVLFQSFFSWFLGQIAHLQKNRKTKFRSSNWNFDYERSLNLIAIFISDYNKHILIFFLIILD